jgi:hypothetical protein
MIQWAMIALMTRRLLPVSWEHAAPLVTGVVSCDLVVRGQDRAQCGPGPHELEEMISLRRFRP